MLSHDIDHVDECVRGEEVSRVGWVLLAPSEFLLAEVFQSRERLLIDRVLGISNGLHAWLLHHEAEEILLGLRNGHNIVRRITLLALAVDLVVEGGEVLFDLAGRTCAEDLTSEVTDHPSRARPHLYLAVLESENLFLLVQEDEGLGRLEAPDLDLDLGARVVNDQVLVARLDHDFVVELLEKLDLLGNVDELELEQLLPRLDFYQGHRYLIVFVVVQQKHHSIADLELGDVLLLDHELQCIRGQAPDSVAVLETVFGDDLAVELVELHEVWPPQDEISEQFISLEPLGH